MKTLRESILSTSNVGANARIKNWIKENGVLKENEYTIKNGIIYPYKNCVVYLFNDKMVEMPDYIKFADGDYTLLLGGSFSRDYGWNSSYINIPKKVISFNGLPKTVAILSICFSLRSTIPSLDIKVKEKCILQSVPIINGKFNIEYVGKKENISTLFRTGNYVNTNLEIRDIKHDQFSKLSFKGFNAINLDYSMPFELVSELERLFKHKAPINEDGFNNPISPDVDIDNYFNNVLKLDITGHEFIQYSKKYALAKQNGNWYKCISLIKYVL